MYAYKLVRRRSDGTLGPLFIDRGLHYEVGKWEEAKCVPTSGFAVRPGFHVTDAPVAPHLKELMEKEDRVWCKVDIEGFTQHMRPIKQGGRWYTAKRMKILEVGHVKPDMAPVFSAVWSPVETLWARSHNKRICGMMIKDLLGLHLEEHNMFIPGKSVKEVCTKLGWPYLAPMKYGDK